MKKIIAVLALALFASLSAPAMADFRSACKPADWKRIDEALASKNVVGAKSLVDTLKEVLKQEMGPTCVNVIKTIPTMAPSNEELFTYEVTDATETFVIHVAYDFINKFYPYVAVELK